MSVRSVSPGNTPGLFSDDDENEIDLCRQKISKIVQAHLQGRVCPLQYEVYAEVLFTNPFRPDVLKQKMILDLSNSCVDANMECISARFVPEQNSRAFFSLNYTKNGIAYNSPINIYFWDKESNRITILGKYSVYFLNTQSESHFSSLNLRLKGKITAIPIKEWLELHAKEALIPSFSYISISPSQGIGFSASLQEISFRFNLI